jgi:hypothetical protein
MVMRRSEEVVSVKVSLNGLCRGHVEGWSCGRLVGYRLANSRSIPSVLVVT